MPTPASDEAQRQRTVAESFGEDAERYDRARPDYPAALLERILDGLPGREVLDVGCGTGIVARQLQAAGCTVLGVDPDERMAAAARRRGLEVEVATVEAWDPAGRTFDAMVAGQAWHWVEPSAGAAKAAAVLRPGGRFAAFWNAFGPPPDLAEAFAEVFRRELPDLPMLQRWAGGPDAYATFSAQAGEALSATGAFAEPEIWRVPWERTYTRAEWLDTVPTVGLLTRVPPERLAPALAGIGAVVDSAGGSFVMGYNTVALSAVHH